MKHTLVIARRELTERRFVIVAALAFCVLAAIVPFMPGVHEAERRNALFLASFVIAVNFTFGLAAALGATIVGRELSERRLSFYFSKPVSAASIWFGKLIAALLLIAVCFGIIAAPALIAGVENIRVWINAGSVGAVAWGVLAAAAGLFLVVHVIGTIVRARSAWIVFDFIAAGVFAGAIWMLGRALLLGYAVELTLRLGVILLVFAAMAIVAGGAWQLAQGRTDRKRSHMELSRFLWIALGGALLVAAAFVSWVVSVTPRDLSDRLDVQTSNGSWAIISGQAKHRADYRASFLYNLEDGRSVRIARMQPWWGAAFATDAKAAFWLVPSAAGGEELWVARLDGPNPRPMPTRVTLKRSAFFGLSSDGSRLAAIDSLSIVSVYDVGTGASLGSAKIPDDANYWSVYFIRPDLVRGYGYFNRPPARPTPVFEYDVARKVLSRTGEIPFAVRRFSPDRARALAIRDSSALEIYDARSGALLRSIPGRFISARYLRDGRIAAVGETLHIFAEDGTPLREIALPGITAAEIVLDAGAGHVVLLVRKPGQLGRWSAAAVDINRGTVRLEPDLHPIMSGNSGPHLLCLSNDGLVVWSPATGERRLVSGR